MAETLLFDTEVQKLINVEPFVPFTLVLASGERLQVTDPGLFVFGQTVVILVQRTTGMKIFRKTEVAGVEVSHVP